MKFLRYLPAQATAAAFIPIIQLAVSKLAKRHAVHKQSDRWFAGNSLSASRNFSVHGALRAPRVVRAIEKGSGWLKTSPRCTIPLIIAGSYVTVDLDPGKLLVDSFERLTSTKSTRSIFRRLRKSGTRRSDANPNLDAEHQRRVPLRCSVVGNPGLLNFAHDADVPD
jgi:hypothetical protein